MLSQSTQNEVAKHQQSLFTVTSMVPKTAHPVARNAAAPSQAGNAKTWNVNRSANTQTVTMSATPQGAQDNNPLSNMAWKLNNMASNMNNALEPVAQALNNLGNPQPQPYMQLAGAGAPVDAQISAGVMQSQKIWNSAPQNSNMAGQAMHASKASFSRASTVMMAEPTVSGASPDVKEDHMDKEMKVAAMGINGFGRIGRLVFRSTFMGQKDKAVVKAINAPNKDLSYLKYLLEYDSVHGRFPGTVEIDEEKHGLIVNGQFVKVYGERDPVDIKWGESGADYICESTGVFLTKEKGDLHLQGGAKKVVFAAPSKDDTPMYVYGVNHENYGSDQTVVSNASCTTNCLAPLSKVINDNFGIEEGLMTTVHATTASNATVDGTSVKDPRGGRANGPNIIPSSTGAAKAVGKVIPDLNGKLTGMAFRVPTTNVSVVDLTCRLEKEATWDDICAAIKKSADGEMKGVIEYTADPVVSQDFVSHPATSVFDSGASIMLNPKFCKLVAWYDNEWAYSNQLVKLTHFMADKDGALVNRH